MKRLRRLIVELICVAITAGPITYALSGRNAATVAVVLGCLFCLMPQAMRDPDLRRSHAGLIMGVSFGPLIGVSLTVQQSTFSQFTVFMGTMIFAGRFLNGYGSHTMMLSLVSQDDGREAMAGFQPTASFMAGWLVPLNFGAGFVFGFLQFILITPIALLLRWLGKILPEWLVDPVRGYYASISELFPNNSFLPTYSSLPEALQLGLRFAVVVGLAGGAGMLAGIVTALIASRGLIDFTGAFDYIKAMIWPVIGFFVGYLIILVLFAGIYGSIARIDATSFGGVDHEVGFWEFMFFSLMTLTTLGYSPLVPVSGLAKSAASLQAFISVAWVVVVFAAVIAYVEPRFRDVRERVAAERRQGSDSWGETDPDFTGFRNGFKMLVEILGEWYRGIGRIKKVFTKRARSVATNGSTGNATTASDGSEDEAESELPDDDTSGVAVSFPYAEGIIERIWYEVEGGKLEINLELTASKLFFTFQDVIVSNGLRPAVSQGRLKRIYSRSPRRARQFTVIIPGADEITGVGYQLLGGYLHIVLKGLATAPDRSSIMVVIKGA